MLVFNSQMHLVTLVFILLEFGMLSFQVIYYLARPQERSRFWYMVLLILLIIYNLTGGLFPDPNIGWSLILQNILAYGAGFLMAGYFPFYFYKSFNLQYLKLYALYLTPLFLGLPFLVFFIGFYPLTKDLEDVVKYGMIIPFVYSPVLLLAILQAIRQKTHQRLIAGKPINRMQMVAVYWAMSPWVCMSVFAILHVPQWLEVLVTNLGFIWVTVLFMLRAAAASRLEHERLLALIGARQEVFEERCLKLGLTPRHVEVAALLCRGLTYGEIGEALFISLKTVDRHVQGIYKETGVKNKIELLQLLGFAPELSGPPVSGEIT